MTEKNGKVDVTLGIHSKDYALAVIAAQLLNTTVEDLCLIALVTRSRQELREALSLRRLDPGSIPVELLKLMPARGA